MATESNGLIPLGLDHSHYSFGVIAESNSLVGLKQRIIVACRIVTLAMLKRVGFTTVTRSLVHLAPQMVARFGSLKAGRGEVLCLIHRPNRLGFFSNFHRCLFFKDLQCAIIYYIDIFIVFNVILKAQCNQINN